MQGADAGDRLLQDGLLFQEGLQLQVLLVPQLLWSLVPVGVVDRLQQVFFEACEFCEFLAETLDLLIEVDVAAELEEDLGGSEVGDAAALG